jgi:hypothetical protein
MKYNFDVFETWKPLLSIFLSRVTVNTECDRDDGYPIIPDSPTCRFFNPTLKHYDNLWKLFTLS